MPKSFKQVTLDMMRKANGYDRILAGVESATLSAHNEIGYERVYLIRAELLDEIEGEQPPPIGTPEFMWLGRNKGKLAEASVTRADQLDRIEALAERILIDLQGVAAVRAIDARLERKRGRGDDAS